MIAWKFSKIYLHREAVDFRKSINGLSCLVTEVFDRDPLQGGLYVFSNKRRNMIKALYWDQTGFALWHKRLEKDLFKWPKDTDRVIDITSTQLQGLLSGCNVFMGKPHQVLKYQNIC